MVEFAHIEVSTTLPDTTSTTGTMEHYRCLWSSTRHYRGDPGFADVDLHVATLVLGSEKVGQCNKQRSWIWGFGQTTEDDGTWMGDCQSLHS